MHSAPVPVAVRTDLPSAITLLSTTWLLRMPIAYVCAPQGRAEIVMALLTGDNVIPFNGPGAALKRGPLKPESLSVINECRDLAIRKMVSILSDSLDKIEDELGHLAGSTENRQSQALYLEARSQAHDKRAAIEAAFKKQFLTFFERKVCREAGKVGGDLPDSGELELSLVEDADLEQNLAINDIARRMTDRCDDELRALSQRMGFLMSDPDLNEAANPMSPETIISALKVACDQMTAGYQTKLTVMKMVEQHMAGEMLAVYRDVNSMLVSRQILPRIRPSYRKTQTSIVRKPAAEPGGTSENETRIPGCAPANPAGDIYATLQQLLAGGSMFDPALSAGSVGPPAFGVTTGSFAPPPPLSGDAAAGALSEIARGTQALPGNHLVAALNRIQFGAYNPGQPAQPQDGDLRGTNVGGLDLSILRSIKAQEAAVHSSPIDVMTIDIVAMLFDYVFEDSAIPARVKALLARLQIPALKVAILDKSFFSRKSHPARRLLDKLAEASMGFTGAAQNDDVLYETITVVVERIYGDFETDVQIFAEVLADLESFLAKRERANEEFVERSARAVFESERREMARMIAINEVERRCSDHELPAPVIALLRGPWVRVLERLYLREGGRQAGFSASVDTADDLIWSVLPKRDADERRRLVSMLPDLLKHLHAGMEIAVVESADRVRFFASLVDCHASAVKAGLRGDCLAAMPGDVTPNTGTGPLFARLLSEEAARATAARHANKTGFARIQFTDKGISIEEIDSGAATDDGLVGAGHARITAVELKRGQWVEFSEEGGRRFRAKLSWISPHGGVYLFTSPGADEALSIAPNVLQQKLRLGQARLLDESSIVDRAVDHMVTSLRDAAGAAN